MTLQRVRISSFPSKRRREQLFPSSAFQIPSSVKKVVNTSFTQFPWTYLLLVRNNMQTAEITLVKRITEKNITFNLKFRMLQHTSSEGTVHGSNNKIQTVNSKDVYWSIRKVKLKVLFFSRYGFFFPYFFHYSFCSLRVTRILLSNYNGQGARVFPSWWFQDETFLTALQPYVITVQYKLSRFLNCQLITTELYTIHGHQTTQFPPKYS